MTDRLDAVQLLRSPWGDSFRDLIGAAKHDLLLMSPYITRRPLEMLDAAIAHRPVKIHLVSDLSAPSLAAKTLDTTAILGMFSRRPGTSLTHLPRLHAKVYVADERQAVVTSANLTDGGLFFNYEFGVRFDDPATVRQVREDAEGYARLGADVPREELTELDETARELQRIRAQADREISIRLKRVLAQRIDQAHLTLLKIRARGKTTHGIFADTLLYLLRRRSHRTVDLHRLIQQIHPDLCDDSQDRVIDGVHFGKRWKHHVRTAQQHLRRRGLIARERELWYAASPRRQSSRA